MYIAIRIPYWEKSKEIPQKFKEIPQTQGYQMTDVKSLKKKVQQKAIPVLCMKVYTGFNKWKYISRKNTSITNSAKKNEINI